MPDSRQLPRGSRREPVQVGEGLLLPWTPLLMLRMVIFGLRVDDRVIPRRRIVERCGAVTSAWWRWTTALPGDRFVHFQRDLIIEVRSGLPRRREAAYLVRQALGYPTVRALGVQAALDLCPNERCTDQWWDVRAFGGEPTP